MDVPRHILGISLAYLEPIWDMPGTYLGYIWHIFWTYLDISRTYMEISRDIYGTYLGCRGKSVIKIRILTIHCNLWSPCLQLLATQFANKTWGRWFNTGTLVQSDPLDDPLLWDNDDFHDQCLLNLGLVETEANRNLPIWTRDGVGVPPVYEAFGCSLKKRQLAVGKASKEF